jgi:GNAT superfamily N-acetyltransferase
VTGAAFRRDRLLRASGYEIGSWGIVNLVLTLPAWSAASGQPWSSAAIAGSTIVLVGLALAASPLHRSRTAKLCGEAGPRVLVRPVRIWAPLAAVGVVLTGALVADGAIGRLVPVWLAIAGAGHAIWGSFTIPEIRRLGIALLVAAAIAAVGESRAIGVASLVIWSLAMGAGWIVTGIAIHRRYLPPDHP